MASRQVGEAQSRLREVLDAASGSGPQFIERPEEESAVVLSLEQYRTLAARPISFVEHLLNIPKMEDFEIERDKDCGRTIDL